MTSKLTRELLYADPVKHFETAKSAELSRPVNIRDFTLGDIVKHTQAVGLDDSLITAKVVDAVVRGAEEDENLWRRSAAVTMMTTEVQRVPLVTPDDVMLKKWVQRTAARSAGGALFSVKLDCSQSNGLYAGDISFTKNDLRAGGFDKMEEMLWCAGQSVGRLILQTIVAKLLADVDATMTKTLANWDPRSSGDDHYGALVGMEAGLAALGFSGDTVLANPTEGADIAVLNTFISEDWSLAARGIPKDLHTVGNLYGRIPIYRHRDVTTAYMIMLTARKSIALGIYQDIQVEGYEDVREGLEGALVSIQFDVKSGKDAEGPKDATSPIAKSWAVCSAA